MQTLLDLIKEILTIRRKRSDLSGEMMEQYSDSRDNPLYEPRDSEYTKELLAQDKILKEQLDALLEHLSANDVFDPAELAEQLVAELTLEGKKYSIQTVNNMIYVAPDDEAKPKYLIGAQGKPRGLFDRKIQIGNVEYDCLTLVPAVDVKRVLHEEINIEHHIREAINTVYLKLIKQKTASK